MFQIDLKSRKSIYEQIVDGLKEMIISGELHADDRIMSVRELAEKLTVNPNTIQKAYRELESEGWIYTVLGRGNFVLPREKEKDMSKIKSTYVEIEGLLKQLRFQGETTDDILNEIKKITMEEGEKK